MHERREVDERKRKRFPVEPRYPWLLRLMQSCPGILTINWCVQGMRGMDRKELGFRLALEAGLAVALAAGLRTSGASMPAVVAVGLLLAHSLNFLLNGQLWVCVRYCPSYRRDGAALDRYLAELTGRLRGLDWLDEAACIGSRGSGTGTRSRRSDIDLRLLFTAGTANWFRLNLLLLRLRAEALVRVVSLDLYAYDGPRSLLRLRQDEPLWILLDRKGRLARTLGHRDLRYAR